MKKKKKDYSIHAEFDDPYIVSLFEKASANWQENKDDSFIKEAAANCGDDLNVLVGVYRYYFYRHQWADAENIALKILDILQNDLGISIYLEESHFVEILESELDRQNVRLFLNTAASYALIMAKSGREELALKLVEKIEKLEKSREFSAQTIKEVILRMNSEEDDDYGEYDDEEYEDV